jgi:septal ring factor EnvC (AmiA/AmiB activator)
MSTHAIFDTSKINVPYISSLLIAAGLGAGVIFAIDAGFYRSFDAEIAHLESQVQAEKTANIKLLDRTKDLQEQLKVVQQNENSLKSQVIGKEQEIVKAHQQVEELSSQKSQLYTNAKTLALCVSDIADFVWMKYTESPPTPTSRSGPEGIIWGAQEWI